MIALDHLHFPELNRRAKYPKGLRFGDYRQAIREDCLGRCVYCDVHENEVGGQPQMGLDHFRPRAFFKKLVDHPLNLLWACKTCNTNKGRKWPAFGTSKTFIGDEGFIDPFDENRSEYMAVDISGHILPLKDPAKYIVNELKLNRIGVRRIREVRNTRYQSRKHLEKYFDEEIGTIDKLLSDKNLSKLGRARLLEEGKRLKKSRQLLSKFRPDMDLH